MNAFCFRLHEWEIEIHTEVPRYLQTLRANLPYYLNGSSKNIRTKIFDRRKICFNIYHRTGNEKWIASELDQKALSQLRQYGFCQIVNVRTRSASIFLSAKRKISDNVLYHAGFLHPLFLNLLQFRATLVHASLVSKRNSGVLIAGGSGAGKSILSVAFLRHGFTYFSDEHPIVELRNGEILGRSFVNRISLSSLSVTNFPAIKKRLKWNSNTRKFYMNPWKENGSPPATCSIDKILFPRFHPRGTFTIQKLKPLELFRELAQDDYFLIDTHDSFRNNLGPNHLRIMMKLANSGEGFVVNYGPADIVNLPAVIENL